MCFRSLAGESRGLFSGIVTRRLLPIFLNVSWKSPCEYYLLKRLSGTVDFLDSLMSLTILPIKLLLRTGADGRGDNLGFNTSCYVLLATNAFAFIKPMLPLDEAFESFRTR